MEISGKVMIITGAGSGIGTALACLLSKLGARVVLASRRRSKLEAVAKKIDRPEQVLIVPADVSRHADLQNLVQRTVEHFGGIDCIINNAGLGYGGDLLATRPQEVDYLLRVNLTAPIWLTQLALPHLQDRSEALIVNISSLGGLIAIPYQPIYGASKRGLAGFSDSLRRELLGSSVHVTCVYPGLVNTEMYTPEVQETAQRVGWNQPALNVDDAAATIVRGMKNNTPHVYFCSTSERLMYMADRFFPSVIDRVFVKVRPKLKQIFEAATLYSRTHHEPPPLEPGNAADERSKK